MEKQEEFCIEDTLLGGKQKGGAPVDVTTTVLCDKITSNRWKADWWEVPAVPTSGGPWAPLADPGGSLRRIAESFIFYWFYKAFFTLP